MLCPEDVGKTGLKTQINALFSGVNAICRTEGGQASGSQTGLTFSGNHGSDCLEYLIPGNKENEGLGYAR